VGLAWTERGTMFETCRHDIPRYRELMVGSHRETWSGFGLRMRRRQVTARARVKPAPPKSLVMSRVRVFRTLHGRGNRILTLRLGFSAWMNWKITCGSVAPS